MTSNKITTCISRIAIFAVTATCLMATGQADDKTTESIHPRKESPQVTTHTTIQDLAPLPGNTNVMISGVPEIPNDFQARVKQYLNARAAAFLDQSDDGTKILIATRFASTMQLHLVEKPMGARTQLTFADEPVADAAFLPGNEDELLYMQDTGGGEFYQIYRYNLRTGHSELLTDGKSRHGGLVVSRDGSRVAFQNTARNGKDTDVYVTDAKSESFTSVRRLTEEEGTWGTIELSADGKKLLVYQYRAIDDADLHVIDVETGKRTQITPATGRGSVAEAAFSADGKSVFLVTDRYGDFNELYQVPADRPMGDTRPESLSKGISWNVEKLAVSPDGSSLVFATNEDGYSKLYHLDLKTQKLTMIPVPSGVISSMAFPRKNSGTMTFGINSPKSPTDVWQVNLASKELTRWTQSEVGGLDPDTFIEPELVSYDSTHSVTVTSLLYRPDITTSVPVLVIFHGGPEGQSRPDFYPFVQLMVKELGIAVMLPNVRGSDGYGKKFLSLDNGIRREESLDDIGATLDWIASQPHLDSSRVAVYGGSYGGYMCLASLTFYPERFCAGVDVVGISSIPTFLQNTQEYRRDLRRAEYGDERIPEVRAVQERISPLNHVDKIKSSLYVLQGKNDPRVPQSEAEQIVRAVREGGKEAWYLLALNEGHGFAKKENRDYVTISVAWFLKKQLFGD